MFLLAFHQRTNASNSYSGLLLKTVQFHVNHNLQSPWKYLHHGKISPKVEKLPFAVLNSRHKPQMYLILCFMFLKFSQNVITVQYIFIIKITNIQVLINYLYLLKLVCSRHRKETLHCRSGKCKDCLCTDVLNCLICVKLSLNKTIPCTFPRCFIEFPFYLGTWKLAINFSVHNCFRLQ